MSSVELFFVHFFCLDTCNCKYESRDIELATIFQNKMMVTGNTGCFQCFIADAIRPNYPQE